MLLLDEMLPPAIGEQLTAAGCDTLAVSAQAELRGMSDSEVLVLAASQGRVLVTDNVRDFVVLNNAWAAEGKAHPGMVLISSKTFPMTRTRSARIAASLLHRHHKQDWPLPGQYEFLLPPGA